MPSRLIAIIFAVVCTALCVVAFFIVGTLYAWDGVARIVISSLFSIVFLCYFLFRIITESFIFNPLRKNIDVIRNSRLAKDQTLPPSDPNPIAELNTQITGWIDDRKAEVERLSKLETYRKEFLGNVSHELKTPIFNIQGYVLTLLDGGIDDPKINRDYLSRAERSVERMISIVDDLEAISQLETGELQIDPERFDIAALAKDVFHAQEMKATAKGIILSMMEYDEKPVWVFADKFRIRQVLTNLVVNSIKYGKEYGETRFRCSDIGDQILIEIQDNGLGIANQHLPRLFERFYRVDKSRSREMGGTGLGLSIVKHIIEAHGQTINVMSTEGVGSVFSFTLKKG